MNMRIKKYGCGWMGIAIVAAIASTSAAEQPAGSVSKVGVATSCSCTLLETAVEYLPATSTALM